eukprot:4056590-Prymnesium_polylepis.1
MKRISLLLGIAPDGSNHRSASLLGSCGLTFGSALDVRRGVRLGPEDPREGARGGSSTCRRGIIPGRTRTRRVLPPSRAALRALLRLCLGSPISKGFGAGQVW